MVGVATDPLIEFREVSKSLSDFELRQVSLELRAGEVHAITGENGSGKSLLMQMLSGWYTPDSGEITYADGLNKRSVSYIDQDAQTFDNLSVAENVFFNRFPGQFGLSFLIDTNQLVSKCRAVFEELEIKLDPEKPMASLGYEERQLVTVVRGFVDAAPITVFDASTSAMTDINREIVLKIVNRTRASGGGVFFISHRVDEILSVADRVSVMDHGKKRETRIVSELSRQELVRITTGTIEPKGYPHLKARVGPPILKVKHLASDPVLKDVDFQLKRGEILGVTGLMGSGRTRLAQCIFGQIRPTSGTIELNGEEVEIADPADAMARGISPIPEDRIEGIFPEHDLVFNVTMAALKRFSNRKILDSLYMRETTRKLTEALDIKPGRQSDLVGQYSGGNQQKILVARWLTARTQVCIMDEPTRGSDVASRVDIYNAINELVSHGIAVMLISSDIEEILGMSDRILVLAGGCIAAEMKQEEATKEKIIACAMENG